MLIGHARRAHVVVAEDRDRLDAVGEVLPEGVEVVGAGEAAAHADDGDRLGPAESQCPWLASRLAVRQCLATVDLS